MVFQNRDFYYIGMYIVLSIVNGCDGIPVLAKPVYEYMTSGSYKDIKMEEVHDEAILAVVETVHNNN